MAAKKEQLVETAEDEVLIGELLRRAVKKVAARQSASSLGLPVLERVELAKELLRSVADECNDDREANFIAHVAIAAKGVLSCASFSRLYAENHGIFSTELFAISNYLSAISYNITRNAQTYGGYWVGVADLTQKADELLKHAYEVVRNEKDRL